MALDIGVGDGSSPVPLRDEPLLALQDDAVYSFLHPLFERLRTETGRYIDLYGDASFTGWRLAALQRMLVQARSLAESLPDKAKLGNPLTRGNLSHLITNWERIVARAEELGRPVVCFGD